MVPPIETFANNHITIPIGAATATALPKTKIVLSRSDLTNILPICGFLYGGSSKMKDEGTPFKIVLDKSFEIRSVKNIPSKITKTTAKVDTIDEKKPVKYEPINIAETVIRNGNLPIARHESISYNRDKPFSV